MRWATGTTSTDCAPISAAVFTSSLLTGSATRVAKGFTTAAIVDVGVAIAKPVTNNPSANQILASPVVRPAIFPPEKTH
jgi:hypothetical protein